MGPFSIYLVKSGFDTLERYTYTNGSVQLNRMSVLNDGVIFDNQPEIETFLNESKIDVKMVRRATSPFLALYRESDNLDPWWKGYWSITEPLQNKTVDVLVILKVKARTFLVTHGHGRFLINPACLEYDFGLRTALNILDSQKVKRAGLFTPSEIAFRTSKQAGKSSSIDQYDINVYDTLLKNVAGMVSHEFKDYFESIDGADGIKFNLDGNSALLESVIGLLYDKYQLETYKKTGFDWIDNFRVVRDKLQIQELDKSLVEAVNARNTDVQLLYPTDIANPASVVYHYTGFGKSKSNSVFLDLEMETQYYILLGQKQIEVTDLKNHQVVLRNQTTDSDMGHRSIYDCIYYDCSLSGTNYFIESGNWYSVDSTFSTLIDKTFDDAYKARRVIPFSYDSKSISDEASKRVCNKELVFNERLSSFLAKSQDTDVLDSKLVYYNKGKVEVCDVLSRDGGNTLLIHNKYRYGSSALSHLFHQGLVSAQLITEKAFRAKANLLIKNTALKFPKSVRLGRSSYVITYGIIAKSKNGTFGLPLFSKIAFFQTQKDLQQLGYRVELCFFDVV